MLQQHTLTDAGHQTLRAITGLMDRHGYAPTVRELADELGLASASSAHARLRSPESAGAVRRGDGRARVLQLTALTSGRPGTKRLAS